MRGVLVDVRNESRAECDVAVHVMAVLDGVLEHGNIPSVQKVGVVCKAGGIAGRKDICAITPVIVVLGRNNHLVEDPDGVNRVRRRAAATIVVIDGVRHVRLVVRAVEVHAIPALREENLQTNTILASIDIGKMDVRAFSVSRVTGDRAAVVCMRIAFK